MPVYANSGQETLAVNPAVPTALYPGESAYLWGTATTAGQPISDSNISFEAVSLDARSVAVVLAPRAGGGAAPGLMVQVFASANPGAAEIDVQDAGVDADGAYETPTGSAAYKLTTWTQEGANWTSFAELIPEAKFVTLLIVANPNGVSFWAKVSYV